MNVLKILTFCGSFQKLDQIDQSSIEIADATIRCLSDGNVTIEVDDDICQKIYNKDLVEYVGILDPTSSESEQVWFSEPYEGKYVLQGTANNTIAVKAKLNLKKSAFCLEKNGIKRSQLSIQDLYLDEQPNLEATHKIESIFGIFDCDLLGNTEINFADDKYVFSAHHSNNFDEWKVQKLDSEIEEHEDLSFYLTWFELLVSFGGGRQINKLYTREIFVDRDNNRKMTEVWHSRDMSKQNFAMEVIQSAYLPYFLQKCASQVKTEIFKDERLGNALRWYTQYFEANLVPVQFIILCTVIEALRPKKIFGGTLQTRLKKLLESHDVQYQDIFTQLQDFIDIRNKIVHEGFGGDSESSESCHKLRNLIVRIFLSILQYEGEYIEARKSIHNQNHYVQEYKTFPPR